MKEDISLSWEYIVDEIYSTVFLDLKWQGLELLLKFFIKFFILLVNAFLELNILFDIVIIKTAK